MRFESPMGPSTPDRSETKKRILIPNCRAAFAAALISLACHVNDEGGGLSAGNEITAANTNSTTSTDTTEDEYPSTSGEKETDAYDSDSDSTTAYDTETGGVDTMDTVGDTTGGTSGEVECGNGIVDVEAGEECDDGNNDDGDGCNSDCLEEDYNCHYINLDPCDHDLSKDDPLAFLKAMGLGCPGGIQVENVELTSPDPDAWGIVSSWGNSIYPKEGSSFLLLSNGMVDSGDLFYKENDDVFLTGVNDNPTIYEIFGEEGTFNDSIAIKFDVKIPGGSKEFTIYQMVGLGEWPAFLNTSFDDPIFISIKLDGEVKYSVRMSANTLHSIFTDQPPAGFNCNVDGSTNGLGFSCDEEELLGTGLSSHGITNWGELKFDVSNAKVMTVEIFLADFGDDQLITLLALDSSLTCEVKPG